jgi:hypothetical protein
MNNHTTTGEFVSLNIPENIPPETSLSSAQGNQLDFLPTNYDLEDSSNPKGSNQTAGAPGNVNFNMEFTGNVYVSCNKEHAHFR